jgi:hypothetical protein
MALSIVARSGLSDVELLAYKIADVEGIGIKLAHILAELRMTSWRSARTFATAAPRHSGKPSRGRRRARCAARGPSGRVVRWRAWLCLLRHV